MSFLELAQRHASKGFYVFPARPDKRPATGFMNWESQATQDPEQLRLWWDEFPDSLPAVAPGVSGHAVIDVDRHEGSADGFTSLQQEQIILPSEAFSGTSLSGNGLHFWFSADVGSVNGVIPGVDRKSRGGYVIVPYELPLAIDIRTLLPESLTKGRLHSTSVRNFMSVQQLNYWLQTVGSGPISEPMYEILDHFEADPSGNQKMSRTIARVVRLAASGESGASRTLDRMLAAWNSIPHNTGNPEEEFHVNVKSAIEKFGEPVEADDALERLMALANGNQEFQVNRAELGESLRVFCDGLDPDWREADNVVQMLMRCLSLIPAIKSREEVDGWREATKRVMKREIEKSWVTS